MIVDCFTHIWDNGRQLGRLGDAATGRTSGPIPPSDFHGVPNASTTRHLEAIDPVDVAIVLGFKSAYLDADIPNEAVSSYVRSNPAKMIGFAGIDPADPVAAAEELLKARDELGLKGIALSPAAQDVHPCSSAAESLYERAASASLPVLFHPGVRIARESKLAYAQPMLLDEVARDHPNMKIIVSHLGYPWVTETLVLIAKHDNVYSDISWILSDPWEAYQALQSAHRFGVTDKLLFASGFPDCSPAEAIEALYGINHVCSGTNLPKIPREALRSIVQSDALAKLGIEHTPPQASLKQPPGDFEPDGDVG